MERLLVLAVIILSYTQTLYAQQASDQYAPELGLSTKYDGLSEQTELIAQEFMVATAHPLATQAAYDVLEAGGNAIDAMVTTQAVLGLVEPQSSGLGGGAFLVFYDAAKNKIRTFDGRETAPIAAHAELFIDKNDKPMAFFDAVVGGLSVGTPGTTKLLADTHSQLGRFGWDRLLEPAIELAERGFKVSNRLAHAVIRE